MYLTRERLRRIVDSMPPQAVTEQHVFSSLGADSTVFLSHKHQEREILFQVKALLESLGMKVYIDWMERNMQHPTNAETAKELKRQIDEQDKFILIATDAAISAPWCNWEIGLADRSKSDQDKIAILPIADIAVNAANKPVIAPANTINANTLGNSFITFHLVSLLSSKNK